MNYQRREHSECDGDGTSLSSHAPVAITREYGSSFVNDSTKGPREPVECRMRTKQNDEDDNLSDQSSACSGQGASSSSMLRAARADALSSSLVETMIEAGRQYESSSRRMMERSTMIQQSGDSGSDSTSGQGGCMMGNISNDSSGQTSSNGAAIVTGGGTSTTSSEEYRYTVTGSGQRNKQSPEDRLPRHHHHHHHHHSSRQTDQSHRSRSAFGDQFPAGMDMEGPNPSSATGYAAAVVAHPSSPRMFSSESSSFFSSSSERANSGPDDAAVANRGSSPLVAPHREPGLHTIRRTMKKIAPTNNDDEDDDGPHSKKKSAHRRSKKSSKESHEHEPVLKKMAALSTSPRQSWRFSTNDQGSDNDSCRDTISGSGGSSGTEGGYAGSASSNEQMAEGSCSSPSVSSDDNQGRLQSRTSDCLRRKMQSTSSNIADFSSGDSESLTFASRFASTASSPSSPSVSSDEQDDEFVLNNAKATRKRRRSEPWTNNGRQVERKETSVVPASDSLRRKSDVTWNVSPSKTTHHKSPELPAQRQQVCLRSLPSVEAATAVKPPILLVGSDIMAHVLTFLEPPEIHDVLSMPLSKEWRNTFSMSEELWRVLCLLEPFKAKVDDGDNMSDDSFDSDMEDSSSAFNRHRMMYSSFVRCMKYLARIKDDAVHGRPPSVRFSSGAGAARHIDIGENRSLKSFLAKARDVVHQASDDSSDSSSNSLGHANRRMRDAPIGVSDDGSSLESQKKSASGRKVRRNKCCLLWVSCSIFLTSHSFPSLFNHTEKEQPKEDFRKESQVWFFLTDKSLTRSSVKWAGRSKRRAPMVVCHLLHCELDGCVRRSRRHPSDVLEGASFFARRRAAKDYSAARWAHRYCLARHGALSRECATQHSCLSHDRSLSTTAWGQGGNVVS